MARCVSCGANLSAGKNVCEYCGHVNEQAAPAQVGVFNCPGCGNHGKNVRAIMDEQTRVSQGQVQVPVVIRGKRGKVINTTRTETYTTLEATPLAQKLALKQKSPQPLEGMEKFVMDLASGPVWLAVVFLLCPISWIISSLDNTDKTLTFFSRAFSCVFGVAFLISLVTITVFIISQGSRYRKKWNTRKEDTQTLNQKRQQTWEKLYYCDSCGSVYMPGMEDVLPAAGVDSFVDKLVERGE